MNASRLLLAAAVLALGACSTMPQQTAQAAPGSTRQIGTDAEKVAAINWVAAHSVAPLKVYWLSYPQKVTVVPTPAAE